MAERSAPILNPVVPSGPAAGPPSPFVTESLRVARASPWILLERFGGQPRGFWGRGGGWVAHGGAVAEWMPAADDPDRMAAARRWLAALSHRNGSDGGSEPRVFGGFSFSAHRSPDPRWAAFPAARFQVPRVELRTDGEAYRLIGRAALRQGDDERVVRTALRAELEGLEGSLVEEVTATASPSDVPPPAVPGSEVDRAAWVARVQRALTAIRAGRFRKVVLARSLTLDRARGVDALTATRRLYTPASEARVFLFEPEPGVALLGASPETLARVHDGEAYATAVAGSIRRGADAKADRAQAERLLSSEKDRREHDVVVQEVVEQLGAIGADVREDDAPHVLTLPGIHHLETRIRARLPGTVTVLDLIERLHPTPAVCGQPRAPALAFLEREEGFDRGWYGAPVGWLDARGNGVTAPALRCALLEGDRCHLFAGAGIVEGSDPEREWDETQLKLETAARALGRAG